MIVPFLFRGMAIAWYSIQTNVISKTEPPRTAHNALRSTKKLLVILVNWRSGITYLSCIMGLCVVYEYVPLGPLQLLLSHACAWIFRLCGHLAFAQGTYFCVDGYWGQITRLCTYVDLFLLTAPFVIRRGTIVQNIVRLSVFLGIVLFIDFVRIVLGIHVVMSGFSWKIGHDLVDYFVYYGILVVTALLWMKAQYSAHAEKDR